MRESVIEGYLVRRIRELHGEQRKVKWINRRGAPDRMIWIPGWRYPRLIETKAPGKPLKPHQTREHARLKKMGFECYKIDSVDDIDRLFE